MSKEFLRSLTASGIKFVRVLWCDNANIIRGKAIHSGVMEHHLKSGVGISPAQQSIPAMYDAISPASGLAPVGEIRLVPDWESVTSLPYAHGHRRAMGSMMLHEKPWPLCPRDFLRRMTGEAEKEGLFFEAAFENEFYLLKYDCNGVRPADATVFASTLSMDMNNTVISDIANALIAQGMQVVQYYPESGPGQQEITIYHAPPMQAADNQIAFRETVHALAHVHGLKASFLPKIFPDKAGNGCHLHLSFTDGKKSLIKDEQDEMKLSRVAGHFIAGLLEHLPALMAITTPTTNSYRRIKPHSWVGAYRCWGLDNREAAIRILTEPGTGAPSHIEFKTLDATSNPYIALGAVIAAGLDGVRRNLELSAPVDCDPSTLSEEERVSRGITGLPGNLGETIELLEKDSLLMEAMGRGLSQAYLAVKKAEYEHTQEYSIADEVECLLERY